MASRALEWWRLRTLGLGALAFFLILGCPAGDVPLAPGRVDARSLAPGEGRFYAAELRAGDVLRLRIEQRGLDVEIRVGGRPAVDLPYGDRVPEEFWWFAERRSRVRVEVRSLSGTGDYRLIVQRLGAATVPERRLAEAFWITQRGIAVRPTSPKTALALLEEAGALIQTPGSPTAALLKAELGRARLDAGDREGGLAAFCDAVALADQRLEPALAGRLIHARGRALRRAWELDRAAEDYLVARTLLDRGEDLYGESLVVNDMAVLADIRGDLRAACEGYRRAARLFADAGSQRGRATAQLNLGRCQMKRGAMDEALPTLLAALQGAASRPEEAGLRAAILREVGWWYRLQRQPERALGYLAEAHSLVPTGGGVLDRLATVYLDLGDMDKARSLYFEALTHVDGDRLAEAHVRANLCRWAEVASRPNQEDEVLIRGGLDQCRRALSAFDSVGATDARATVLFLSAQLEWRRGRLEVAEVLASGALSLIESQLPLAGDVDDRTSFLAERQEFYRLLIELRMELHDRQPLAGWDARALEIYELTRARSLLDLLAAESVDPALQLSPELRWAEKEAADRLAARTRGLRARALDEGRPALGGEAELAALEERLAALRHRLEREEPSYLALTQPRPLNVAAIRGLLDDDTLLLALHLGERRAVLWTVNRRKVTGRWLAPRHDLERSAEAWYGLLSDPGWNRTNAPLERRRARRLSELILRPIAEDLARHRRLVFIGDGAFQRLPFGALPSLQSAGEDRPLVMEHEIVQLPSAAVLALLRRMPGRRAEPEKLLVVIADPIYEASDPRLRDAATATRRRSRHRRLRGAAAEAADLADLAGPSRAVLLQGFEARRDQILAGSLKGFSIVHFATHSRTEAAPGRPPGLLLSRLDEHARPIPYVFGLPELYALDLPADMAVLSGCATAIGKEIQGEGLMGLTRGFIHAGTPRVVVSLWSVRDRAARELMRRFYEGLMKHHQPPAEALRRAQVAMREAGWEVRDWAPFVLHGEWKPFALDASLATAAVSDNKTGSERVYKE